MGGRGRFALAGIAGCMAFVACGLDLSGEVDGTSPPTIPPTTAPVPDAGSGTRTDIDTGTPDGSGPCIKCGDACVPSCATCSGKTSECDGVCVDGCDNCPNKTTRCPGACVPGTTTRQATCRASKAECRDVGCACSASTECVNGEIVCDLGRCVRCDDTNDNKGLTCSNGDPCDSDHCDD